MKLTGLASILGTDPAFARVCDTTELSQSGCAVAPVGVRPALVAAIASRQAALQGNKRAQLPVVVLTATGRDADEAGAALGSWMDPTRVAVLPAWETLPHERLSPQVDTMARRISVLRRLAHPVADDPHAGPIDVLVVPVRAFLQPVIAGLGDLDVVRVRRGDLVDLADLTRRLLELGYQRVDMVEQRGQISVRGGIVDIFPPHEAHPLRIELWGDEVEEIRVFSLGDQRTLGEAEYGVWATACRELLLTSDVRQRARHLVSELPGAADILELAAEGIPAPGIESLAPLLTGPMEKLIDLIPRTGPIIVSDPERVKARASDLVRTTEEFLAAAWEVAATGGHIPLQATQASFLDLTDLWGSDERAWWELTSLPPAALAAADPTRDPAFGDEQDQRRANRQTQTSSPTGGQVGGLLATEVRPRIVNDSLVALGIREVRSYRGDVTAAIRDIAELARARWRIVVTTEGPGPAKRLVSILSAEGVGARLVDDVETAPEEGLVLVTTSRAGRGFVAPELRLTVLTETDLTGRSGSSTRDMRRMPSRRRQGVDPLSLRPGDFVVHEQHGIGRFLEMTQRSVGRGEAAVTRDYLVIEYAPSKRGHPGDRLFVPTDSLDQISKYTGSDQPTLTRMGGADWAKAKAKARKAVDEVAKELVRLYAVRQATKGHAFSPDTPWQRELEDAFPYVETPDQLVTIDEVKADMEKSVPMDRLLTGDVGYGKTEIAVRAAFKAIQDGKQVAVLVPTTLLVQQHLETFQERYAGFPVTVGALSRFSTPKEARAVKEGLASGGVDLVIGTHTLLTGTVTFKDLGLVVIDEEQRFGVEHKETLKALRADVDVLSMSATPIPRTLEMAVTGIREMSILQTPPEERQPVLTFVGAYSDAQVVAAIRRELLRDGQVFFVHNRVESIARVAAHVADLVPEARVRIAHGKLSEHQLEEVIIDFWNQEFDVLVCTTIVETGLDISNANTLIVDRADAFGLSQLHQLRGRVGRGRERAYAYFFHPADRTLSETAHERLKTIAQHSELGAGLAVAQKDLEIRGAGNLLGGAQSGHIEGVGFDLYVRMVADAVAAVRGHSKPSRADLRMDLPVDAHVPPSYIPGERLRLEAYAKVAAVTTPQDESDVRAELIDRYGPIPHEVDSLFAVARLRERVRAAGIEEVVVQGKYIRFAPVELGDAQIVRIKRLYPGAVIKAAVRQVLIPAPMTARIGGQPVTGDDLLTWVETVVTKVLSPIVPPANQDSSQPR